MNKDIYIFRKLIKIFMISAVLAVFSAFTALSSGYVPGFGSYVDSGPGAEKPIPLNLPTWKPIC